MLVGHETIRRLENAGVKSLPDQFDLQEQDLVKLGVKRSTAKQIIDYVIRRRLT